MRHQDEADDRQRTIHLLVRQAIEVEDQEPIEHLSCEDLAGLVSGTLFKTECARVENHLLSCAECRAQTARLHRDYEAGVVPMLLRRAPPRGPRKTSFGVRLTRRYSPLVLALVVFVVAVVVIPLTMRAWLSANKVQVTGEWLVLSRVGTPVYTATSDDEPVPAEPGAWLDEDARLSLESGDELLALDDAGRLVEIRASGVTAGQASSFLLLLFEAARADRAAILREADEEPKGPSPTKLPDHSPAIEDS